MATNGFKLEFEANNHGSKFNIGFKPQRDIDIYWDNIADNLTSGWEALSEPWGDGLQDATETLKSRWETLSEPWDDGFQEATETLKSRWETLSTTWNNGFRETTETWKSFWNSFDLQQS